MPPPPELPWRPRAGGQPNDVPKPPWRALRGALPYIPNVRYVSAPPVPKALDHDDRRRELALACTPLFARSGYAALNMRQIALELGVSTGVLYHYFPGKAALFEAVAHAAVETDVDRGTALLLAAAATPPERLALLLAAMEHDMPRFVTHYRVLVEYSGQLDSEQQVGAWTTTLIRLRTRYARAIGEVLELGDEAERDLVLLTVCGMILRAMCGDTTTDKHRVAAMLGRALGWDTKGHRT
jgi:AcrR family transcriptional regulator